MRKREGGGRRGGGEGGGLVNKRAGSPAGSSRHIMSDNEDFVQALADCRQKMLQTALFVLCAMFTLCMVGGSQRMSASCG